MAENNSGSSSSQNKIKKLTSRLIAPTILALTGIIGNVNFAHAKDEDTTNTITTSTNTLETSPATPQLNVAEYQRMRDSVILNVADHLDKGKFHRAVRDLDRAIAQGLDEFTVNAVLDGQAVSFNEQTTFYDFKQELINNALKEKEFEYFELRIGRENRENQRITYLEGLMHEPLCRFKNFVSEQNWDFAESAIRDAQMVYGLDDAIVQKWHNYVSSEKEFVKALKNFESTHSLLLDWHNLQSSNSMRRAANKLVDVKSSLRQTKKYLENAKQSLAQSLANSLTVFQPEKNKHLELEEQVNVLAREITVANLKQEVRDIYESCPTNFLGEKRDLESEYTAWKQRVSECVGEEKAGGLLLYYGEQVRENAQMRGIYSEFIKVEEQLAKGRENSAYYHALLGLLKNESTRNIYNGVCSDMNLDADPLLHSRRKFNAIHTLLQYGNPELVELRNRLTEFHSNRNADYEQSVSKRKNFENALNNTAGVLAKPLYFAMQSSVNTGKALVRGLSSLLAERDPKEELNFEKGSLTQDFASHYGLHAGKALEKTCEAGRNLVQTVKAVVNAPSAVTNAVHLLVKPVEKVPYLGPVVKVVEENTLGGEYFDNSWLGFKGNLKGPYDSFQYQKQEEGAVAAWTGFGIQIGTLWWLSEEFYKSVTGSKSNKPAPAQQENPPRDLGGQSGGTHVRPR
ncbi:hypothetical protein HYV79_02325 [Candidatus Woesearchaeota archaeon]|nr:hypothetical protein [Candidatus Woesearchaeota archaeon]